MWLKINKKKREQQGIFFFKMQFCFLILFPITVIIIVKQTLYETDPKYMH